MSKRKRINSTSERIDSTSERIDSTSDRIDSTTESKNKRNINCYVLIITRLYNNAEVTTDRQQYKNKNEALNDIKHLIMDLLEVQVHSLKLYNEEERIKTGLMLDFNDIFIYNLFNRCLELKESKDTQTDRQGFTSDRQGFTSDREDFTSESLNDNLIKYLSAEFFGYTIKFKIWQIITNDSTISKPYKVMRYERLTYKEVQEMERGHPLYRT